MAILDRLRSSLSRAAVRTQQRSEGPPRTSRAQLVEWARAHFGDLRLVVVSNREPYSHTHEADGLRWARTAGGLTVALDEVMRALGGTWIAHGSGSADFDVVDDRDHVACPPDQPRYTLRRLRLSRREYAQYYSGFANSGLWPLCHIVYVRPRFRLADWKTYQSVNERFAEAVIEEVGDRPAFVFLQDYHLALAAQLIKQRRPQLKVATFWHIPWPNPEVFRVLPWKQEILEGLLANDLVGFHIRRHALNFLDTVATVMEARVDLEHLAVERGGRRTWIRTFPIGVDAEEIAVLAESPAAREAETRLREELAIGDCKVGLGVDRLDYTKGIPERLAAVSRMLEKYPEWAGRFVFIQIGVPSRIELPEYRRVQQQVRKWVRRINERYPRPGGLTVHLIEGNLDFRELIPYYRMADVCTVTSLHDGMNLVAKEYVAASPDLEGALVLSPFTGAARELERAWMASPYDREGLADACHQALSEKPELRRQRMAALRESVQRSNIYDWTLGVLDSVLSLEYLAPAEAPGEPEPALRAADELLPDVVEGMEDEEPTAPELPPERARSSR